MIRSSTGVVPAVSTRAQSVVLCILAAAALVALALAPLLTVRFLVLLLSLAFSLSGVFRVSLALFASFRRPIAMAGSGAALRNSL